MVELEKQINFTNLDNSYVDVLSELTHIFNRNGHELFLVGGCVKAKRCRLVYKRYSRPNESYY